jgi:hypothetical protein
MLSSLAICHLRYIDARAAQAQAQGTRRFAFNFNGGMRTVAISITRPRSVIGLIGYPSPGSSRCFPSIHPELHNSQHPDPVSGFRRRGKHGTEVPHNCAFKAVLVIYISPALLLLLVVVLEHSAQRIPLALFSLRCFSHFYVKAGSKGQLRRRRRRGWFLGSCFFVLSCGRVCGHVFVLPTNDITCATRK